MDFREKGFWHYAMVSPEGGKHRSRVNYDAIVKEKSFSARDGFCNECGTMDPNLPQNLWKSNFTTKGSKVEVNVLFAFDTLSDLEQTIAMNFKKGFSLGLQQLDELLLSLKDI